MRLSTIGFTKKSAEKFFGLLADSGATTLIDIRLNNVSQLASFAKRDDLAFFLREICGMSYRHELQLAPTADLLGAYQKGEVSWARYEEDYLRLIRDRRVESSLKRSDFHDAVLLCSEATPERCHRRLAAEYLTAAWGGGQIVHL